MRFWKAASYVFCSSFRDISKSSCVQHLEKVVVPAPSYLKPEEYGWEYNTNSNSYEAVMTGQLLAPKHCGIMYLQM